MVSPLVQATSFTAPQRSHRSNGPLVSSLHQDRPNRIQKLGLLRELELPWWASLEPRPDQVLLSVIADHGDLKGTALGLAVGVEFCLHAAVGGSKGGGREQGDLLLCPLLEDTSGGAVRDLHLEEKVSSEYALLRTYCTLGIRGGPKL